MDQSGSIIRLVPNTIYNILLSDIVPQEKYLAKEIGVKLFDFFKASTLFRWQDANNDCEDRANAICILLDEWKIPNYKAWVFGSSFLTKAEGALVNNWKYHVAALLPIKEGEELNFYVIDPATLFQLDTILNWATNVTDTPFSHYLIKWNYYYIFHSGKIYKENWHKRNRQNYKWTIQGLSGINGVTKLGKAQIAFRKNKIKRTEQLFKNLLFNKPSFLL